MTAKIQKGAIIVSKTNQYIVESISYVDNNFAVLASCRKCQNNEILDLKCIHRKYLHKYKQEANVLFYLKQHFPKEDKFVKILEMFHYGDWFCFALESSYLKLSEIVESRTSKRLGIRCIKVIAHRMLSVLDMLKKVGVTHTSITAESIECISSGHDAKLTGFSAAGRTSELSKQEIPIICGFSAPEILLNAPVDESADIWGLACTLAGLCFGFPMFPAECNYEYMRMILQLLGPPIRSLLDQGRSSKQFFKQDPDWRFKTVAEHTEDRGWSCKMSHLSSHCLNSLNELKDNLPKDFTATEVTDLKLFVDLLGVMLVLNPKDRITPADALKHPFFIITPPSETSQSPAKANNPGRNTNEEFILEESSVIERNSSVYCFETFLGGGSFGVVSKFKNLEDDSRVAVKLITNKTSFTNEVRGLSCLRELDPNKSNIIRCIDHFPYKDSYFIFFELLDQDLCDFMAKRRNKPLKMGEVRCIAKQLLVALRELKHIHVTHLDIKPNNILLVNHSLWPFKVKLADLGLARKTRLVSLYDVYQNRHYRAPEIFLGLPRDEGMDMWSLGCVLVYLILGNSLFKIDSEYSVVCTMITLFGMPHKTSLDTGWRVEHFFKKCVKGSTITWELKTPQEYKIEHNKRSTPTVPKTKPLAELLGQEQLKPDTTKFRDFLSMIDLFKRMLTMEAADRITPDDALNHSFITMENLPDASESPYVKFGKEVLARSERARSERASPARVREMEEDSDQSELSGQVKQSTFTLEKGVQLIHGSNIYQVEEVIGSSANGIVVKCIEEDTDEKFAVKVFKKEKHLKAINEANVHNHFSIVNTDNNNLITMIDCFIHNGHFCLAFELLQLNLCDFVHQQHWKPMRVADIRPIAQQMLVSLSTLKYNGVIHADIKPSSVMLVNHDSQPFKVKLIGFGSAHETGTLTNITKVQTVGYRAPEVHMGLPFNESIDIWGLGCTLVFLYLAKHLFPEDEYSVMRLIVKCCGMPAKEAIQRGKHSHRFFVLRKKVLRPYHIPNAHPWRLKTKMEYERGTGKTVPSLHPFYEHLRSLDNLVTMTSDLESLAEQEDLKDFVNLVKRMIVLNPSDRIRPDEALKHPFILRGKYPNTSCHPSVLKACETPALSYHTIPDEENTNHDLTDSSDALEASTLQLKKGVKIFDESKAYIVEEVIGPESFGGVVRCRDTETDDVVEIKIFRREYHLNGIKKVNECSNLSNLDPSKKETITFIDCFIYKDCLCLVFDPAK